MSPEFLEPQYIRSAMPPGRMGVVGTQLLGTLSVEAKLTVTPLVDTRRMLGCDGIYGHYGVWRCGVARVQKKKRQTTPGATFEFLNCKSQEIRVNVKKDILAMLSLLVWREVRVGNRPFLDQ